MYSLLITVSFLTLTSAALLPSASYLPQNQGGSGSNIGSDKSNNAIGAVNRRPQQELEKHAAITKQDQEINDNGFHYGYETSNGIVAEEAGNSAQTQGGFAYKGDDGNIYSITFTAGEDGFRPQGAHLPVPPPTPDEILEALKQNERDEAAGIFDNGQYDASKHGGPGITKASSGQRFGSNNRESSFNSDSGYKY